MFNFEESFPNQDIIFDDVIEFVCFSVLLFFVSFFFLFSRRREKKQHTSTKATMASQDEMELRRMRSALTRIIDGKVKRSESTDSESTTESTATESTTSEGSTSGSDVLRRADEAMKKAKATMRRADKVIGRSEDSTDGSTTESTTDDEPRRRAKKSTESTTDEESEPVAMSREEFNDRIAEIQKALGVLDYQISLLVKCANGK